MTTTTKVSKVNFAELDTVFGVRIRLNNEQKDLIKRSWDRVLHSDHPEQESSGRGGVRVATNYGSARLENEMGCSRVILGSLLGTNERHSVQVLRRWERVLGISLLDRKTMESSYKDYLDYVFK